MRLKYEPSSEPLTLNPKPWTRVKEDAKAVLAKVDKAEEEGKALLSRSESTLSS